MTNKIVDGKKPLSAKKKPAFDSKSADVFGNKLALSPEIRKELEDQGLVGRFVNAKQLQEMGGYHPKDWRPYKRKTSGTIDTSGFLTGSDPNGYIRRGDAILACKTVEEVENHRAYLQARADRHKNFKKQKSAELREYAREHGIKTVIDDNDEYDDAENE